MEVLIRELNNRPLSLRQLEEQLGPYLPQKQMSGDLPWVEVTKRLVNSAIDSTSEILLNNVSKIIENYLKKAVRRALNHPQRDGRNYCVLLSSLITHVHLAFENSELSGAEVNKLISLLLAALIDMEVASVRSGEAPATISRISVKLNVMLGHCEDCILDTLLHCRTLIYANARRPQIFVPLIKCVLSSVKDTRTLSPDMYLKYLLLAKLLLFMTKKKEIIQMRAHIKKSLKLPGTFVDWAVQNKIPWLKLNVWSTRLILKRMTVTVALKTLFSDMPASVPETDSQNTSKKKIDFLKASDNDDTQNDCKKVQKKINKKTSVRIHEEVANSTLKSKQTTVENTGFKQEKLNGLLTVLTGKYTGDAAVRMDTKRSPKIGNLPESHVCESQQEVDNTYKEFLDATVKGKERNDDGSVVNRKMVKTLASEVPKLQEVVKTKKTRRLYDITVEDEKCSSDAGIREDTVGNVRAAKGTDTREVQQNVVTTKKKIKLPDMIGSVNKYTSNVDLVLKKESSVIVGETLSTEVYETQPKKQKRKRKKIYDMTLEKCTSDVNTKLDKKENGEGGEISDLESDEMQVVVVKAKKTKLVDSILEVGKSTHGMDILEKKGNVKLRKKLDLGICETLKEIKKKNKQPDMTVADKQERNAYIGTFKKDKRGNIKVNNVAESVIYETQQEGDKTKKKKKLHDMKLEKSPGDAETDLKETVKVKRTSDFNSDVAHQKEVKINKNKRLLDNVVKSGKHTNDIILTKTSNINVGQTLDVEEMQVAAVKTKKRKITPNKALEEVLISDADTKGNKKKNGKIKRLSDIDIEERQKVVDRRKNTRTLTDASDKSVKDSEFYDGGEGDVTVKYERGMKTGQFKNVKRAHLEVECSLSVKKKKKVNLIVDQKLSKSEALTVKSKCKGAKNTQTSDCNKEDGAHVEMPTCGQMELTHIWDEVHPHSKPRTRTLSDPLQDTRTSIIIPRVRRLSDQLTERRRMIMETRVRTPSDEKGRTFRLTKRKLASLRRRIRRNSINFTVTNLEPRNPQNRLNNKWEETSESNNEQIEKDVSLRKDSSQENRIAPAAVSLVGGKPCEVPDELHGCDIEVPDNLDSSECIVLSDSLVRSDMIAVADSCINKALDKVDNCKLDSSKADSDLEEINDKVRDTSVSTNKKPDLLSNYFDNKGAEALASDESENVILCHIVEISKECPKPPSKGIEDPDSEIEILDEKFVDKTVEALAPVNEASDVDEASGTDSDIIPCDETAKMFTDEENKNYHTKLKEDEMQRKVEDILKEEERELKQKLIKDENLNDTNADEERDTNKNVSDPEAVEQKVVGSVDLVSKMINKLYKPAVEVERKDVNEAIDLESSSDDDIEVILQTIVKDTGRLTSIDGLRGRLTSVIFIGEELSESDCQEKISKTDVQVAKTLENGHSSNEKSSMKGPEIVVLSNENFGESNNQETETLDNKKKKVCKDQEAENMDSEKKRLSENQNIEHPEVVTVDNQISKEANEDIYSSNMKLGDTENNKQLASHSSSRKDLTEGCLNNNEKVNVSHIPKTKIQNQDVESDCRNIILKLEASDKSELPTQVKPTREGSSKEVCNNERDVYTVSQKKTDIECDMKQRSYTAIGVDAVIDITAEEIKNENLEGNDGVTSFEKGITKFEAESSFINNPTFKDVESELVKITLANGFQYASCDEKHVNKGSAVDAPNSESDSLCCSPIMEPLQISDDSPEFSINKVPVTTDTTLSNQLDVENLCVHSNLFGCILSDDQPNNDDRTTNGELESITEESEGKSTEGADEAYEASSDASEDPTPKVRKRARLLRRNFASHGILQEASDSDASPVQRTRRRRLSEVAGVAHSRPRVRSQSWCQDTTNSVSGPSAALQTFPTCLSESAVDEKKLTKSSDTVDLKTNNQSDSNNGKALCSSSGKQNNTDTSFSVTEVNLLNTMSSSSSMSSESVMGTPVKDVDITIKDVLEPELRDIAKDSLVSELSRSSRLVSKLVSHLQSHSETVESSCISLETFGDVADTPVSISLSQNLNLETYLASEQSGDEGNLASDHKLSGVEGNLSSDNKQSGIKGNLTSDNKQSGLEGNLASDNIQSGDEGNLGSDNKQSGLEGNLASDNKQSDVEGNLASDNKLSDIEGNLASDNKLSGIKGNLASDNKQSGYEGNLASDNKLSGIEGNLASENKLSGIEGNLASENKQSGVEDESLKSDLLDFGLDETSSDSLSITPQRREEDDESGFTNKIKTKITVEREINQSSGTVTGKTSEISESKTASEQLDEREIHTNEGKTLDDNQERDREYFDEEEGEELEVLSTSGTDENEETPCCHYPANVAVSEREKAGVPTTQMMLRSLLRRRSSKSKTKGGTLDIIKRGDIPPSIPHLKVHCVSKAVLTKEVLISPEVSDEECELVSPGLVNDANGAKSFPIPESLATSPKKIPSPITTLSRGPRNNSGGIRSPQKVIPEEQDETTLPNGIGESVSKTPNTSTAKAHYSLVLQDIMVNKYSCSIGTSDKSTLTRQLSKTPLELVKLPKSPARSKASSSRLEISTDSPKRKFPSIKRISQVENVVQEKSVTKVNIGRKFSPSEDLQNILETDECCSTQTVCKTRRSKSRETSDISSGIEDDSHKSIFVNVGSPEEMLVDSADETYTVSKGSNFSESNFASEELLVTDGISSENVGDTKLPDEGLQELKEERDDWSTNTQDEPLVHLNTLLTESPPKQNSSGVSSGSPAVCSSPLRRSRRLRTNVHIPPPGTKKKKTVGVTHYEESPKEEAKNVQRVSKSSTPVSGSEKTDELSSKLDIPLVRRIRSRTDGVPTSLSPKNMLPAGSSSEEEKSTAKPASPPIRLSPRLHRSVTQSSSCGDESPDVITSKKEELPVRLSSLKVLLGSSPTREDKACSPSRNEVATVSPSKNCSHTESSQASAQVPVLSKKDGSSDTLSPNKGRSPINSSSSNCRLPVNSSPSKGRSPVNTSSKSRSPVISSPSKGRSPVNRSPSKGRSPVSSFPSKGRSPVNSSPSKGRSPVNTSSSKGQSPVNSSFSKGRSPVNSSSSKGRSPVNSSSSKGRSPVSLSSSKGRLPVSSSSSKNESSNSPSCQKSHLTFSLSKYESLSRSSFSCNTPTRSPPSPKMSLRLVRKTETPDKPSSDENATYFKSSLRIYEKPSRLSLRLVRKTETPDKPSSEENDIHSCSSLKIIRKPRLSLSKDDSPVRSSSSLKSLSRSSFSKDDSPVRPSSSLKSPTRSSLSKDDSVSASLSANDAHSKSSSSKTLTPPLQSFPNKYESPADSVSNKSSASSSDVGSKNESNDEGGAAVVGVRSLRRRQVTYSLKKKFDVK